MSEVTLDDLMDQTNAEDEEKSELQLVLTNAKSYVRQVINRPFEQLTTDEQNVFNMAVLQVATSWYLNRDGSAKNVSRSFSALNSLIDIIRQPAIGG